MGRTYGGLQAAYRYGIQGQLLALHRVNVVQLRPLTGRGYLERGGLAPLYFLKLLTLGYIPQTPAKGVMQTDSRIWLSGD